MGFFGSAPRSRSLAESSRGWVSIQMVFYVLPPFLGGGVCGLRRCRSAIQLIELLVDLSRPEFMWDFYRYHCHITLNGSVVVHVHCIAVCVVLFLYREGFII